MRDSPELDRRRRALIEISDEATAYEFLDYVEPDALATAYRIAFGDQAGPVRARDALRAAWDAYRHDRCRGVN